MLEAFDWGLLAQSSLLLAGLLVCWVTVPTKVVGILGGFGAGAMIAAVSFDLLPEAQAHIGPWQTGLWMLVGVAVLLVADQLSSSASAPKERAAPWASSWVRSSTASPESAILGIQVGAGISISLGFVAAVFISNIPRQLRPRPTLWQADGDRDGSASSGCWWSSPAASPPPSVTWPPT
jgi:ZIP family zinc transporter